MADVASAVFGSISAVDSSVRLIKKTGTLFTCSDAREQLNAAISYRENALQLMEKYTKHLPHDIVDEWKIIHDK